MALDLSLMQLGKKPFIHRPGTPMFKTFRSAALAAPPAECDYTKGVTDFGVFLNGPNSFGHGVPAEGLGNCTICGPIHGEQIWSLNSRAAGMIKLSEADALDKYTAWDGYSVGNADTDQGGELQSVMTQWQDESFPGCFNLDTFASIHEIQSNGVMVIDPVEFKTAVWLLGGANVGVQLPVAWQGATTWDVGTGPDYQPNSWGPHCIWCVGYNSIGPLFISWGAIYQMTWAATAVYLDEAWGPVSRDFLQTTWTTPSGFDIAGCEAALSSIAA